MSWKQRTKQLKRETYALYLAYRDPRVPLLAKILAACVVAYALSPIDLIPDFIPVLGYLDDLILIPAGIALALRMIPSEVMNEYRQEAQTTLQGDSPNGWFAAGIIVAIWLLLIGLLAVALFRWY